MTANGLRTSDFWLSNEVAGFGSSVQGGIISFCCFSVCSCLYLQPAQAADVEGPYGFIFVFCFYLGVHFRLLHTRDLSVDHSRVKYIFQVPLTHNHVVTNMPLFGPRMQPSSILVDILMEEFIGYWE